MPNLKLGKKQEPPSPIERFRSSVSVWQIVVAAVSAGLLVALIGIVSHRLKGRSDSPDGEYAQATATETNSGSAAETNSGSAAETSSGSAAETSSGSAAETSSGSAAETSSSSNTPSTNESPLTDRVQKELSDRSDAVHPDA
jgi:hypothetical protein